MLMKERRTELRPPSSDTLTQLRRFVNTASSLHSTRIDPFYCYHVTILSSFYLPNTTTVCTSTSIQSTRARQQGPTRTLTAALKHVIKQLLGTYSITQVKYYRDNPGRPVPEGTFPTHTYPNQRASFIIFLHLQRSMASSLFSLRA